MIRTQTELHSFWNFDSLKSVGIRHFVTDRHSFGDNSTLGLSTDAEIAKRNRALLAQAMQAEKVFLPKQVHLTNILNVSTVTKEEELADTDALITNERGVCIAVMSADCVPILLYDKENIAIGAVHSGWRGTVAHILLKTLQRMQSEFGTKGENVIAAIGPSVCQQSYEVGQEVIDAVYQSFPKADLLLSQPNGKARLDLWRANAMQLLQFGVLANNIEIANLCTVINNDLFYSARKGDNGRFAAGIMLV